MSKAEIVAPKPETALKNLVKKNNIKASNIQLENLIQGCKMGLDKEYLRLYAQMTRGVFDKIMSNEETKQIIDELKNVIISEAALNVQTAVSNGDVETSKWVLKTRARELYGDKVQVQFSKQAEPPSEEEYKKIEDFYGKN